MKTTLQRIRCSRTHKQQHTTFFLLHKIRHQQHTEQHTLLIIVEGCY
jgi:hypothetical protein